VFSPGYVWSELRRRFGRTLVTAIGLAAGVGLVMSIIGVSDGLDAAQNKVLSPLGAVGTDIIVTRTIAPTTSQTSPSSSSKTPFFSSSSPGPGGSGPVNVSGAPPANVGELNAEASSDYENNNDVVLTDLAKLGKPGTRFTHDFFFPDTLIPFPSAAVSIIEHMKDVTSSVGGLLLKATHESGTVPDITAKYKTGGETLKVDATPPSLTPTEMAAEQACIQKLFGVAPVQASGGGGGGVSGSAPAGGASSRSYKVVFNGTNPAFEKCMTPSQKAFIEDVEVPEQTIEQTINPPTTDTETKTYTAAGVDPASPDSGLVTESQLTAGTWFTADSAHEILVDDTYASANRLKVGSSLSLNGVDYRVVGLVAPTLTGDVSDLYFAMGTAEALASEPDEVDEVLITVKNAADVNAVAAEIKRELPGATVLTSKTLADHVTGSLTNAKKLADDLGGALAIVVLIAAFLIAALLTLASVSKRVREIGTLRAIGWSRARVVRQIVAETAGIGIVGAVIGVAVGFAISAVIAAIGPGLSVTSTGLAVGASAFSSSTTATVASLVHLTAPIHLTTVVLGVGGAVVGGLLAGVIGGWRASRLAPAVALRDLG
jgi:ABC-type antimicrobial peptide transport system permease subunit